MSLEIDIRKIAAGRINPNSNTIEIREFMPNAVYYYGESHMPVHQIGRSPEGKIFAHLSSYLPDNFEILYGPQSTPEKPQKDWKHGWSI